jgi:hypothetical protein
LFARKFTARQILAPHPKKSRIAIIPLRYRLVIVWEYSKLTKKGILPIADAENERNNTGGACVMTGDCPLPLYAIAII